MPTIEYKCVEAIDLDTAEKASESLTRMASEGWMVFHVSDGHLWSDYKFIFQRPLKAVGKATKRKGKLWQKKLLTKKNKPTKQTAQTPHLKK